MKNFILKINTSSFTTFSISKYVWFMFGLNSTSKYIHFLITENNNPHANVCRQQKGGTRNDLKTRCNIYTKTRLTQSFTRETRAVDQKEASFFSKPMKCLAADRQVRRSQLPPPSLPLCLSGSSIHQGSPLTSCPLNDESEWMNFSSQICARKIS